MQKYGLRIGQIGIEFPSVEDRNKALQYFTKGSDVKINTSGIKFSSGEGSFSVYDRDTKEVLTICHECEGTFLQDTCHKREYPKKYSYGNSWESKNAFICDACYAKQLKAKEVADAKKTLEGQEDE